MIKNEIDQSHTVDANLNFGLAFSSHCQEATQTNLVSTVLGANNPYRLGLQTTKLH
jgi:hypothetical protein